MQEKAEQSGSAGQAGWAALPTWKKSLVAASVALMLVGGGLYGYARMTAPDTPANRVAKTDGQTGSDATDGGSANGPHMRGFLPDGQPAPPESDGDATTHTGTSTDQADDASKRAVEKYSPAVFQLGLAFFLGFSIGYAIRLFIKLAMVAIGVAFFMLFGLEHIQLVSIHWDRLTEMQWIMPWLQGQFESLADFLNGALPSGASAVAGLAIGVKKT